ncbi:hypothetical protein BH23ACT9_BH23ACT9_36650 [soil metagenome]
MEVMLRCEIPDVPGRLATLAGAIGEAGGDIQAVEVVQSTHGTAIDDLWIQTTDMTTVVAHLEALEDIKVIHTGPSRGVPGDATARLAAGIDALLSGAMNPDDGLPTLIGGLLRADTARLLPPHDWPSQRNRRVLRFDVSAGVLVLEREYRFLDAEIQRASQVLLLCERAAAMGAAT